MLMNAQAPFEEQDLRIVDLIEREGRALVIGMNKWDLVENGASAMRKLREETDHWLPQVKGAPVVALSGLTGAGLDRLMAAVVEAHAVWNRRAPTADAVPDAYRRYLVNGLRAAFALPGTPIRLTLREKKNPYAKRAKRKSRR